MVEQLLASKMPGGFSVNSARKYLESRWGLGEGRQDSCLIAAVVLAPAARLPFEQAAHQFFDDIASKHIAAAGLLSLQDSDETDGGAPAEAVDPEALKNLREEQNIIARKKLELYAEQLQIDLQAGLKNYAVAQNTINELEEKLDLWTNEHGDAYAAGIKPIVDTRKVRVYDSWWNWALQDAYTLFHELTTGALRPDSSDLSSRIFRIANRSTPKLIEVLQYMITVCKSEDGNEYKAAEEIINSLIVECKDAMDKPPVFRNFAASMAPKTTIDDEGKISVSEVPRVQDDNEESLFTIKRKSPTGWVSDEESTNTYLESFSESSKPGIDFEHRVVLLTGAGAGSIGSEILRGLLSGGAKVVVTTSSFSLDVTRFYQDIYVTHGAPGSQLVVIPFNQGSQQDIEALLTYIYDSSNGGLGWDLDAVIPFAAISEKGREIDSVDSKSQLAHRIMLTNTVQMIGAIKRFKVKYGSDTRPAQVVLPLSPNHGNFGGDGLYAESKLALESLFDKWRSESWSNYLSICGASIGWTRGTGLMSGNDIVAEDIEKRGVRTFSQKEMATSILALMAYPIVEICQTVPLYADLNGGLEKVPDLPDVLGQIRKSINKTADVRRALAQEALLDGEQQESLDAEKAIAARANISLGFPELPTPADLKPLAHLKGMVDLERVVVIAGFSELGPHGNARTRWEMEAYGKFSLEGCVEMAWIMGLIRYTTTGTNKGKPYTGWLDAKTNEPVEESDIKGRYEKHILDHSGIRLVDPELWDGYDPHKKQTLQEVVVEESLKPFEASKETAEAFRREHGANVDILEVPESSGTAFTVRIKKGAVLMIPKALDFGNDVAGQIPSGWNPRTYGITDDIIASVDRITLYVLICTIESLLSAGISDPYEIYQYIHTSQVGNCVGSGAGGIISLEKIHKARSMERPASKDVLQETFNNTIAAWVNMLIMSSNGPIRTPVGACATAIESLDNACDLISSGKAKLCLVGGVDDLQENVGSYPFPVYERRY
jgi:fatty acid synthase subunit alpha